MPPAVVALVSCCALLSTAVAAQSPTDGKATNHDALFYRAFFIDRELEQPAAALALYQQYLEAAPRDRFAGQAAHGAIKILRDEERTEEARALRQQHAAVLAETTPLGINDSFLDPAAEAGKFVARFESESREVFTHRQELLDLLDLAEGQRVADIGAGTGFFAKLFARAVGTTGKVFAVDISPKLVEHLRGLAKQMELPQLEVVHCSERSTGLPEAAIDVAFICDTYHHFSHPAETMTSLHRAMRPGGQLFLVEFERIEGKSREWILDHVRAGQEVFRAEIEAAGFRCVGVEDAPFLSDNYVLRFERE
ncbi:MAG: class I SAM-dependent methyltransferase [Planctomycetota bacterium]